MVATKYSAFNKNRNNDDHGSDKDAIQHIAVGTMERRFITNRFSLIMGGSHFGRSYILIPTLFYVLKRKVKQKFALLLSYVTDDRLGYFCPKIHRYIVTCTVSWQVQLYTLKYTIVTLLVRDNSWGVLTTRFASVHLSSVK